MAPEMAMLFVTWPNTFVHKVMEEDKAWWAGDPTILPLAPAASPTFVASGKNVVGM